jgi:predicted GTPase
VLRKADFESICINNLDFKMSTWPIIETDESDSEEDYLSHQCRRFRILVMGKAGVGKSTLLSRVFGIPEHIVSRSTPGYLDNSDQD